MKKWNSLMGILVTGIFTFFSGPAQAVSIMDQSQQLYNSTGSFHLYEQSFQQSNNNITGAGVFLGGYTTSPFGDINLWIEDLQGTMIAGGSISTTGFGWYDVDFQGVFGLTANTEYHLLATTSSNIMLAWYNSDVYSGGSMLIPNLWGDDYDLSFRTFADNESTSVPEPSTIFLLGIGLVGVAAFRPRRNKNNLTAISG